MALETRPSGVVDQRICPFVFARPSTKSFLFHGLEDPLSFSDPRPPLNYTFPRLLLPLREYIEYYRENNIAPHLVKIYLRCHTMITSFAWETGLIHRLDDIRSQTATGEENIQCWFYIHIYIYRCGADLKYTDRCFRGGVFVPRTDFHQSVVGVTRCLTGNIHEHIRLANASLL